MFLKLSLSLYRCIGHYKKYFKKQKILPSDYFIPVIEKIHHKDYLYVILKHFWGASVNKMEDNNTSIKS